jgi:hypothetical protein
MALNTQLIADDIKALAREMYNYSDKEQALEIYSQQLAVIIVNAILSAEVSAGIPVATNTGTGSTTANGNLI